MQVRISGMEDRNKTKVALKSPHIVGLFWRYSRSLLTLVAHLKDDERRESEQQLLQAEEVRRTLEVKLAEAQRRSGIVGLFYLYSRSLLPVY
jgi:hypothetical protein